MLGFEKSSWTSLCSGGDGCCLLCGVPVNMGPGSAVPRLLEMGGALLALSSRPSPLLPPLPLTTHHSHKQDGLDHSSGFAGCGVRSSVSPFLMTPQSHLTTHHRTCRIFGGRSTTQRQAGLRGSADCLSILRKTQRPRLLGISIDKHGLWLVSHFSPLVLLTFYLSARSVSVTLRSLKLIFQVWSVVNTQSLISYHMLRTHSKIVYLFMYLPLLCLFGAVCFLTEAALSVHRCSRSSHLFFYFSALNFFFLKSRL